jgi:hypothetical protein
MYTSRVYDSHAERFVKPLGRGDAERRKQKKR